LSRLPAGADPLDAAAAIGAIGGPITIVIAGGATVSGIAVGNARPERKPGNSVGLSFSYRIKASFFAPTNGAANNRICGIEFTHQLLRAVALSTLISGRQGAQHDLKLGAAPVDLGEAHAQYLMLFVHHAVKKGATAQKGKGGALA
jgi:hypothetical protein